MLAETVKIKISPLLENNPNVSPSKPDFSFPKAQHLKSERLIGKIFKGKSSSAGAFPLRAVWEEVDLFFDTKNPTIRCQVAMTVPKKTFKRAHDRNYYKRLIREAYRLHKTPFLDFLATYPKKIALMIIFTGKEATDFATVQQKMKRLLEKIVHELAETANRAPK